MNDEQKINVTVDHTKEVFYANGIGTSMADLIVLDFKQTLPRIDVFEKGRLQRSFVIKHNPIGLNPTHLKMLYLLVKELIEKIEKEHGEIKLPEDWRATKEEVAVTKPDEKQPSYIG